MLARMLPGAQPRRGACAGLPSSLTADPFVLNMKRDFKTISELQNERESKMGSDAASYPSTSDLPTRKSAAE